jgi:hypothetical protein
LLARSSTWVVVESEPLADVVLEVADQGFGAAEYPAAFDHPGRGPALGSLDERRILSADLGVEREQLVDPLLIDAVGKPVVEIPLAGDRAGGPQRSGRQVRMTLRSRRCSANQQLCEPCAGQREA